MVELLAQGHTAHREQSWAENSGLLVLVWCFFYHSPLLAPALL